MLSSCFLAFQSLLHFARSFQSFNIYTDGSSKNGIGSWAFVVSRRGKFLWEKSGRVRGAQSNSMEFQAAIEVLSSFEKKLKIILFSDSRILIDAMTLGPQPRAHQDQINQLLKLSQKHQIQWKWIKAHSGHIFNERCDELCRAERSRAIRAERSRGN